MIIALLQSQHTLRDYESSLLDTYANQSARAAARKWQDVCRLSSVTPSPVSDLHTASLSKQ